jgi:hypothetical protein
VNLPLKTLPYTCTDTVALNDSSDRVEEPLAPAHDALSCDVVPVKISDNQGSSWSGEAALSV